MKYDAIDIYQVVDGRNHLIFKLPFAHIADSEENKEEIEDAIEKLEELFYKSDKIKLDTETQSLIIRNIDKASHIFKILLHKAKD